MKRLTGYGRLFLFFLPLWFSGFMQGFTGNLINSGLVRMESGVALLASFALARSLMQAIISPMHMIRPTVSSLARSREDYAVVRRFTLLLTLALSLLLGAVAGSGILAVVLGRFMGADGESIATAEAIFRVLVFYPLGLFLKDFCVGVLIRFERTWLGMVSSLARIAFLFLAVSLLPGMAGIPREITAGGIFLLAPLAEGGTLYLLLRLGKGPIGRRFPRNPEGTSLSGGFILRFYGPLALTSLLSSLAVPFLNGSIGHMGDMAQLASFTVGYSVVMNLNFPLRLIHQVSIRFGRKDGPRVFLFSLFLGAAVSLCLTLLSLTDLGVFVLGRLIGLDRELIPPAMNVIMLLIPLPLVTSLREVFSGLMMEARSTLSIGFGKTLYIAVLLGGLALFPYLMGLTPLAAAPLSVFLAEAAEFGAVFRGFCGYTKKRSPGSVR